MYQKVQKVMIKEKNKKIEGSATNCTKRENLMVFMCFLFVGKQMHLAVKYKERFSVVDQI